MNTLNVVQAVDKYFQLTKSIEMLTAEKRDVYAAILEFMSRKKQTRLDGKIAYVTLTHRQDAKVDPARFYEAVGRNVKKLLAVCSIRMNPDPKTQRKGARDYVGNDVLDGIATAETIPVLTVRKQKATNTGTHPEPAVAVG
jgi:hypothetical protein